MGQYASGREKPRILIVTPEITYLPKGMGNMANRLTAKAGGLADVSAALASSLYDLGADVHVALPHYRQMFNVNVGNFINEELRIYKSKLSDTRIHLAEDRVFYYRDHVYGDHAVENMKLALTFQREVINNILPRVNPDLVHCNDWMTGLIPAAAKRQNIVSLFTLHNIHSLRTTLEHIEDSGVDAREFWNYLYFDRLPPSYAQARSNIPVDFLLSGIFSSDYINTVSPTFLKEIVEGRHSFVSDNVLREVSEKYHTGRAEGVLNSPDPKFNPQTDPNLPRNYGPDNFFETKRDTKIMLQQYFGLEVNGDAAMFFWPSRLDPNQKGCQLLTDILYRVVEDHPLLQVVVVANGPFQKHFREIVQLHDLRKRVAVCDFDDKLSHVAYAASDYIFMPSLFEPCGLPQMIGPLYGSLPLARDTGGIHDTVVQLDTKADTGNGFLFKHYDSVGLRWAIDQAMKFQALPKLDRIRQIARVMRESVENFNLAVTAQRYINIYRKLLGITPDENRDK